MHHSRSFLSFGLPALLLSAPGAANAADHFGGQGFYYGDPHAHTGLSHDGWSSDLGDGCPGNRRPEGAGGAGRRSSERPARDGSGPPGGGARPARDGSGPPGAGSRPARDGSGPPGAGSGPPGGGSRPARDGAGPLGKAGASTCGSFADVYKTATANGLDWVVLSDHVNGRWATSEEEFKMLVASWGKANPAELLVIPGVEDWFTAGKSIFGHKNLLFFGDPATLSTLTLSDVRPTGSIDLDVGSCKAIGQWMEKLTARFGSALIIPHHPMVGSPMPTDWTCHSGVYEPAVEMFSSWGNGLGWDRGFNTPSSITESGAVELAMDPAGQALHLGFLAGTDGHNTLPGDLCQSVGGGRVNTGGLTMAVVADGVPFDRTALYDAIRLHSTIATSGPRIPLSVSASDAHGDVWTLGQDIALPAGQSLNLSVKVPEADAPVVTGVWLITPKEDLALTRSAPNAWSLTLADNALPAWGYLAVQINGSTLATCDDADGTTDEWEWASPAWMSRVDHDWDHDGVSFDAGDCADDDPAVTRCDTGKKKGGWHCGWGEGSGAAATMLPIGLVALAARKRGGKKSQTG